jgi:serine/threonine protein kinase
MSAQATERKTSPPIPEKIGKFTVLKEVGRGSTGIVYLAHDAYNGRDVAIKVYGADGGADEEQARIERKMFLAEAHLVGRLHHPYILPIYDAGEEQGRCYIVTEHVHNARTLAAYCKPGSLLPIPQVIEAIFKCAKALHYAHACGVIHRDIKPSNILLTQDGDVRIIDFGIALVADSQLAAIEGIAGSPSYMSPEQVQSLPLSNRSDLYSLGAVMYELLTGSRPFKASDLQRLLHQIVYATAPPIHTLNKEVPEEIENVVAIALQKDPGKRYKSGLDFAAELTRVHQRLRGQCALIDREQQFEMLRRLTFFQEFSHAELWEVLRASAWQAYEAGEEIVTEGEVDDSCHVLVLGSCVVLRHGQPVGSLESGDCFGEASYVPGAGRTATIRAMSSATVLKVSAALLEQVSATCQVRFNRVFLRSLMGRLQSADGAAASA